MSRSLAVASVASPPPTPCFGAGSAHEFGRAGRGADRGRRRRCTPAERRSHVAPAVLGVRAAPAGRALAGGAVLLRAEGSYAASMWPADLADQIEFYGMHRADLLGMLTARLPPGLSPPATSASVSSRTPWSHHRLLERRARGGRRRDRGGWYSFAAAAIRRGAVRPGSSGSVAYRGVVPAQSVSWPAGMMRNWLAPAGTFSFIRSAPGARQLRRRRADRRGR